MFFVTNLNKYAKIAQTLLNEIHPITFKREDMINIRN